ncbi:PREDICTED: leucine-rich repeat-containing protein 24-like [Nicrophorus vespilloides]|uniref:Leucine-rich repeat-containing protein 24-like n=1 Tax=Nicrophorus vespilloides TaxID=110193 RepID=A0ABM1M4C3_NICVS|nr:PREDICTED: leucine-rich repeat-containing protein 24-like [Nicrophorus vespilloides]
MPRRFRVLLAVIVCCVASLVSSCPESCVCKWKNGKQTVECSDRGLLVVPEGMDTGTQVLEFAGNNLRHLPDEKFSKMELINLQRIYLSRCQITTIDEHTFKGLTNLVELDLSENGLEIVPSAAFSDCLSLMRLSLSANPIRILKRDGFNKLRYLSTLEMSRCELEEVEDGAFDGLKSLEWLRLDGNKLKTIPDGFPVGVKGVELQGNPWECDCHLLEFRGWLESFSVPHSVQPVCSGPSKLALRPLKSIPPKELACLPDVSPTTFYLEIGEGKNVSLLCQINAVPEAHVSWRFHDQILQNDSMVSPGTRLIYYVEEGGEDKKSELFIYNTNREDNGTFICSAENAAGIVQSNYTIRIVLKEEPDYEVVVLPFEFILIILSATGISFLIICVALILSIVKCQAAKRKAKESSNLIISNSTKDSFFQDSVDEYSDISKESSNVTLMDRQQALIYSNEMNPSVMIPINNPPLLSCYQLEQNPDLINDTGRRREGGDGQDETECDFLEKGCNYRLTADVHLNPVGLLNTSAPLFPSCYRTLPYARASPNSAPSQSRDAELLAYGHFTPSVRHTADGYPARHEEFETPFCVGSPQLKCKDVKSVGAQTQTDLSPDSIEATDQQ